MFQPEENQSTNEQVFQDRQYQVMAIIVGNKEKGRISKRVFQENKACQIFRKTSDKQTCAYQGVRNVRFFGKFGVFVFLKHPF